MFSKDNIRSALQQIIESSNEDNDKSKDEVLVIKARITKLNKEIDNLNQALAEGVIAQYAIKAVEDRGNEIAELEGKLVEIKNNTK